MICNGHRGRFGVFLQENTSPQGQRQDENMYPRLPTLCCMFLKNRELRTTAPRYKVNTGYHQSFLTVTLEGLGGHKGHKHVLGSGIIWSRYQ